MDALFIVTSSRDRTRRHCFREAASCSNQHAVTRAGSSSTGSTLNLTRLSSQIHPKPATNRPQSAAVSSCLPSTVILAKSSRPQCADPHGAPSRSGKSESGAIKCKDSDRTKRRREILPRFSNPIPYRSPSPGVIVAYGLSTMSCSEYPSSP